MCDTCKHKRHLDLLDMIKIKIERPITKECIRWCFSNIGEKSNNETLIWDYVLLNDGMHFYFSKPSDAVRFKLMGFDKCLVIGQ